MIVNSNRPLSTPHSISLITCCRPALSASSLFASSFRRLSISSRESKLTHTPVSLMSGRGSSVAATISATATSASITQSLPIAPSSSTSAIRSPASSPAAVGSASLYMKVPARACSSNCMRPTLTNSPVPSSALLSGRVMVVAGCLFSMTVGSTGGAGVMPSASSRAALRGDGSNSSTSPSAVVTVSFMSCLTRALRPVPRGPDTSSTLVTEPPSAIPPSSPSEFI
mmetsp:Transcript_58014/g.160365  ORF Transcript_58014/g.160365 Transcript_58014/m.160365 type:complete len:226 (+) Transcript_58014:962-1639(+)